MAEERKTVNGEPIKQNSQFAEVMKRLSYNKGAMVGGVVFLVVVVLAVFSPWISPYSFSQTNVKDRLMFPCLEHLFGTDQLGRDVLSRILYGARYSLVIGVGSVVMSAVPSALQRRLHIPDKAGCNGRSDRPGRAVPRKWQRQW
jgi:ABC-type dipeptide/oligopeptide/nickel transport system permease subunit